MIIIWKRINASLFSSFSDSSYVFSVLTEPRDDKKQKQSSHSSSFLMLTSLTFSSFFRLFVPLFYSSWQSVGFSHGVAKLILFHLRTGNYFLRIQCMFSKKKSLTPTPTTDCRLSPPNHQLSSHAIEKWQLKNERVWNATNCNKWLRWMWDRQEKGVGCWH